MIKYFKFYKKISKIGSLVKEKEKMFPNKFLFNIFQKRKTKPNLLINNSNFRNTNFYTFLITKLGKSSNIQLFFKVL